ncbi:MAG: uroporphyrinogen decarboxylase family protein [Armatimonadota bacterium]|nr:uroporphyrinogen-III decarboxylase-like protein [bacterium]
MGLKREPDFDQFLKVLWRKDKPNHLPFYEHIASPGFIASRTGADFDKMSASDPGFWEIYVDFWIGMGYDCVPMEIPPYLPLTAGHDDALSEGSEALVVISNREDYDKYPWPDESKPIDFSHFETVGKLLPDGAKIVGGVSAGPYEWVSRMLGTIGMSYLLMDDPELVEMVFKKVGALHISAVRQLATMDAIGALRQGDDLGFKTSTFLSPETLRQNVFPTYKAMAEQAHNNGKPFILHSCGQLGDVYEDIIEYCKVDAKHSFEDGITPVSEFKKQYGTRITPLGGLDVDVICRSTEEEVRKYAREQIEKCFYDGYWALGTGNSLTNYMPVENYIAVLEEGINITA